MRRNRPLVFARLSQAAHDLATVAWWFQAAHAPGDPLRTEVEAAARQLAALLEQLREAWGAAQRPPRPQRPRPKPTRPPGPKPATATATATVGPRRAPVASANGNRLYTVASASAADH